MTELTELTRLVNQLEKRIDDLVEPELGRWITWTPTIDQNGAVASTIVYARYITFAQSIITQARITVTAAGSAGSDIIIAGQPSIIEPANTGTLSVIGNGVIQSGGVIIYQGALVAFGVGDWRFYADGNAGALGTTPSFALANNDIISFTASYER